MASEICVIAPYQELVDLANRLIEGLGMEAEAVLGDLHDGLVKARELVAKGAEVLVSRGGTALLLKRHLPVPVIEVEANALDLLSCLNSLPAEFRGQIRVVGFGNVIRGAELIGELLHLDIRQTLLGEGTDVQSVLATLARDGVEVVVGDAVTVRLARSLGLRGLLITSGQEAVQAALQEARRLLQALRQERQRTAQMKAILDTAQDAVVAVDRHNTITVFNRVAEELFGIREQAALGRRAAALPFDPEVRDLLTAGEPIADEVKRVRDLTLVVNRAPIMDRETVAGGVTTFRNLVHLQTTETKVRRELYAKGLIAKVQLDQIVALSPPMHRVKEMAARYARIDSTVLILGESGTGKEMFGQSIHNLSTKREGPFVAINCAALPESLLESELFGYAEGAFTGAARGGRAGLFELAHRGTIFLDEIGEIPLPLQARLLRVLQERQVMRIGGDRVIPVDLRVIAATNRNLTREVEAGRFRQDLYYRLNVLTLSIPPLRERREDIPDLFRHFLAKQAARYGREPAQVPPDLITALREHDWPGNVREVMNIAERVDLIATGGFLDDAAIGEILTALAPQTSCHSQAARPVPGGAAPGLSLAGTLDEIVERIIAQVLAEEGGNHTQAARRLGMNRTTLWRRLRRENPDGP